MLRAAFSIALTAVAVLVAPGAGAATPQRQLLLTFAWDSGTPTLKSARLVTTEARIAQDAAGLPGPWRYELKSADGAPLAAGALRDDGLLRSPLSLPGEPETGHRTARVPGVLTRVRVPWVPGMAKLELNAASRDGTRQRRSFDLRTIER